MKLAIRSAFTTALCVLLSAAAFAAQGDADFYYNGPLDSWTGERVSSSETASSEPEQVRLSDGMYYDFERRMYAYPAGDSGFNVYASVANGMIAAQSVTIAADDALTLEIYRDGEAVEAAGPDGLSQIGRYVVSAKSGDRTEELFHFEIVGERAELPGGYSMPEGFYILDATLEGEEAFYERSFIGMEKEGFYHIEYVCPANGLHYTLETTVDRTPPQIALEGKRDEQGRFHSAVDVKGIGPDDTVVMTHDEASARFPQDGHIVDSGFYTIWITDSAGNTTMEQFAIMVYLDVNSFVFFALICVSLAGVLGYMFYKRRKLRAM